MSNNNNNNNNYNNNNNGGSSNNVWKDLSEFCLSGRLTRDPSFMNRDDGSERCYISVASDRGFLDSAEQPVTQFNLVTVSPKWARSLRLKKGDKVFVKGDFSVRSTKLTNPQTGEDMYDHSVNLKATYLISNGDRAGGSQTAQPQGYAPAQQPQGFAPAQPQGFAPAQPQGFAPAPQGYVPAPQGYVPAQPQGYVPAQPQEYVQAPQGFVPAQPQGNNPFANGAMFQQA